MKIPQHADQHGYYFEMTVHGASQTELVRGVNAAWGHFLAAGVHPWDAAAADHHAETRLIGTSLLYDVNLIGIWNEAQILAISACCKGWQKVPQDWKLDLTSPNTHQ